MTEDNGMIFHYLAIIPLLNKRCCKAADKTKHVSRKLIVVETELN